jgi:hypothetical protein
MHRKQNEVRVEDRVRATNFSAEEEHLFLQLLESYLIDKRFEQHTRHALVWQEFAEDFNYM